jgi:hypothetical protein
MPKETERRDVVRKLIPIDRPTFNAIDELARDQMKDLAEITEEAFRDLLRKHGRSADLKEALRLSTRRLTANDNEGGPKRKPRR